MNAALISPLSIAPMIDWSNTHFRVWMRLLAPCALVYTEMQTTGAVLHRPEKALYFDPREHPVALQLGGADLKQLAQCAQMAEQQGFAEVNLNLGCPSDKVQAGNFGACLMQDPERVADCISAIRAAVHIPVSAKVRIGINHQDSFEFFHDFVQMLVTAGCDKLIVHARKAWLQGLNPKQNRTIPPLHYDYVYRIKALFPHIPVVINGNIQSLEEVQTHMGQVDGVMLGRIACQNPYQIAHIHAGLFPSHTILTRTEVLEAYWEYMRYQIQRGVPLTILTKHLYNFACAMPYAKRWKSSLQAMQQQKQLLQQIPLL